jgi:hypothetical protein
MGLPVVLLVTCLLSIATSFANAETSPAIAVGNAKTVIELRDKVIAARTALSAATTDAERVRLTAALVEAQKELDVAVQSVFSGSTGEGISPNPKINQVPRA